jgi:hypothetical protein
LSSASFLKIINFVIGFILKVINFVFGFIFKDQTRNDITNLQIMSLYKFLFIFVRFEPNRKCMSTSYSEPKMTDICKIIRQVRMSMVDVSTDHSNERANVKGQIIVSASAFSTASDK